MDFRYSSSGHSPMMTSLSQVLLNALIIISTCFTNLTNLHI